MVKSVRKKTILYFRAPLSPSEASEVLAERKRSRLSSSDHDKHKQVVVGMLPNMQRQRVLELRK